LKNNYYNDANVYAEVLKKMYKCIYLLAVSSSSSISTTTLTLLNLLLIGSKRKLDKKATKARTDRIPNDMWGRTRLGIHGVLLEVSHRIPHNAGPMARAPLPTH
jgi:hypothetical protein